jgi:hypothetical protein
MINIINPEADTLRRMLGLEQEDQPLIKRALPMCGLLAILAGTLGLVAAKSINAPVLTWVSGSTLAMGALCAGIGMIQGLIADSVDTEIDDLVQDLPNHEA